MSRNTKIVLVVCAVIFAMCGVGGALVYKVVKGAVITDPAGIRAVAAEIADFEVPPGTHEAQAMDLAGMKSVMIFPDRGERAGPAIVIMQFGGVSGGMNRDQMEQQLRSQASMQANMQSKLRGTGKVGKETLLVKGKPVELTSTEFPDGSWMRQGVFPGRGGPVMVTGSGKKGQREAFDAFMRSIK